MQDDSQAHCCNSPGINQLFSDEIRVCKKFTWLMSILLIILLISLLNKQPKQDKLSISAPLTLKKKLKVPIF